MEISANFERFFFLSQVAPAPYTKISNTYKMHFAQLHSIEIQVLICQLKRKRSLRGALDLDRRSISHLKQLILHNSRRQRMEFLPD